MATAEADFHNEMGLESSIKGEPPTFIPSSMVVDGFSVSTGFGKRDAPDRDPRVYASMHGLWDAGPPPGGGVALKQ